jgi:hypothetical protein
MNKVEKLNLLRESDPTHLYRVESDDEYLPNLSKEHMLNEVRKYTITQVLPIQVQDVPWKWVSESATAHVIDQNTDEHLCEFKYLRNLHKQFSM